MSHHEDLLRTWSERSHHRGRGFISDGIIDESRWRVAPRRVLFLLKEAYGDPGATEDWDIRAKVRDEWIPLSGKMWWNMAYWAYACHTWTSSSRTLMPAQSSEYAIAHEALLASAVVNIKKSGGESKSDADDIASYAKRDGDLIRDQIRLIRPEIVVCGRVWDAVRHLWPRASAVTPFAFDVSGCVFVDFWHPANHSAYAFNYYALGGMLHCAGIVDRALRAP